MALVPTEDPASCCLTGFQKSLVPDRIYMKGSLPQSVVVGGIAPVVRILSWNIERGYDPDRIAAVIAALRPDVACLQEVDWGNERTGSRDVLDHIAGRLGMLGLFAVEFFEIASPLRSARLAGGGVTGNAILTRFAPETSFRVELPAIVDWQRGLYDVGLRRSVRRRLRKEPRVGSRCGIGAILAVGSARLAVCCLHLEDKAGGLSGRWSQFCQAVQTLEARSRHADTRVVAGDLNTFDSMLSRIVSRDGTATALGKPASTPEAAWWKGALLPHTGYHDPFGAKDPTFSVSPMFRAKLDWIAVKRGRVLRQGIGDSSPSDHLPIWADLALCGDKPTACGDRDGTVPA